VGLFLTRNLLTGGAERVFVNYVNHARSMAPVVGLLERRGALLGELAPHIPCLARVDRTVPPSRLARLATQIPGETFARLALECLWLRESVRSTGATLVSSFLMRAHIVALLTKLTLLPRLPVVLNVHEHMSESARFLYPHRRDRAMMRWITRHLFPRADRIIVVAEALKRDLVVAHGVPEQLIDVVNNPLEVARIRAAAEEPLEQRWADPCGRETIIAVGRLVHLKGCDLLLEAFAQLRRTRDARLVFVGEGPEQEVLESMTARLGLRDHVVFAGRQANPWRMMKRATVLALTSRTEAFPNVLTEAMALGVPVLATNCSGGVQESLLDGACGVLVPAGDVTAIAQGLDRLLGDGELRARLAAAGERRVTAFDLPTVQARYESLLAGTLSATAAREGASLTSNRA